MALPDYSSMTHPYEIGENIFIRTVTCHYTGKLVAVFDRELVINNAAWIAEDGRFADAVKSGQFDEVEPYPDDEPVIINRDTVLDCKKVDWPLPRKQK